MGFFCLLGLISFVKLLFLASSSFQNAPLRESFSPGFIGSDGFPRRFFQKEEYPSIITYLWGVISVPPAALCDFLTGSPSPSLPIPHAHPRRFLRDFPMLWPIVFLPLFLFLFLSFSSFQQLHLFRTTGWARQLCLICFLLPFLPPYPILSNLP